MKIPYATIEDLKHFLGTDTLSQLVESTPQIESFLEHAQGVIDAHLAKAYTLPVEKESLLTHACVVIAAMSLWSQTDANDIPQKYQNAYASVMNMLNALSKEEIYLRYSQSQRQEKQHSQRILLDSTPSLVE